jgi:hypothetical protein
VSERLERISKLLHSQQSRTAFIKAKLSVLVPAQIRSLRLKSENPPMPFQRDLARESDLHQSRISMFETPGGANMTLETLAKIAAGLRVGVVVKFVPLSEMVRWKDEFSPDSFDVTRIDEDEALLHPDSVESPRENARLAELSYATGNAIGSTYGVQNIGEAGVSINANRQGALTRAAGGR